MRCASIDSSRAAAQERCSMRRESPTCSAAWA